MGKKERVVTLKPQTSRENRIQSSTIPIRLRLHLPHGVSMRAIKMASPHRLINRALATTLLFLLLRMPHLALPAIVHHVLTGVRLDGARWLLGLDICF
jgi:hypothetical protein